MLKSKEQVLEDYLQYRRLRNHTDAINDIKFHINNFLISTKTPLEDFDDKVLMDYLDTLKEKYSTNMLNQIKSSYLKNFIKWYFIDWSGRFRNLDRILKTEKAGASYKAEDMLNEDEFKKLIQGEESHFWKAYFMTQFYGACRPIEVCNLKWVDIEFTDDGAYITIFSNKNKNSFIKFIPQDVAFYIKELQSNGSEYIFYNKTTKKPLTQKGAYWKIRELSKRVLGKQIHLYTLRHSIATILYNKENVKDDDIAKQMGHTKSMKGKYVHNDKTKLKEIAKKIYVKAELTPKQKVDYEKRIAELESKMSLAKNEFSELKNLILNHFGDKLIIKDGEYVLKAK